MNRKLIWLNVLMVAVLGAAGYQWRQMTRKSAEQTKAFLSQPPRPQQVPVYVPAQPVAAVKLRRPRASCPLASRTRPDVERSYLVTSLRAAASLVLTSSSSLPDAASPAPTL